MKTVSYKIRRYISARSPFNNTNYQIPTTIDPLAISSIQEATPRFYATAILLITWIILNNIISCKSKKVKLSS
jgi:hypothetical protein